MKIIYNRRPHRWAGDSPNATEALNRLLGERYLRFERALWIPVYVATHSVHTTLVRPREGP